MCAFFRTCSPSLLPPHTHAHKHTNTQTHNGVLDRPSLRRGRRQCVRHLQLLRVRHARRRQLQRGRVGSINHGRTVSRLHRVQRGYVYRTQLVSLSYNRPVALSLHLLPFAHLMCDTKSSYSLTHSPSLSSLAHSRRSLFVLTLEARFLLCRFAIAERAMCHHLPKQLRCKRQCVRVCVRCWLHRANTDMR